MLLSGTPANSRPVQPGDVVEVEVEGLGRLVNQDRRRPRPVPAEFGAQPTASEEVVSTALGGDWEFRGIRPPARSVMPAPRMCLILSENWTMTSGRDLPRWCAGPARPRMRASTR